jgi:uncharacterized protein with PIN domain
MIAADTSTWVAFLEGERGTDVQTLDRALKDRQVWMVLPPVTIAIFFGVIAFGSINIVRSIRV